MPGPWIYLGDNMDFYVNLGILPGTYMETILHDTSDAGQGHGLWRIISADQKRKQGFWLEAQLVAASDKHFCWWLHHGLGKDEDRKFRLHLRTGPSKDCKKTKRKPPLQFHTDYFRFMDTGDLTNQVITWAKAEPAKRDLEDEVSLLQGGAPRGSGKKPRAAAGFTGDGLGWTLSEDEEGEGAGAETAEVKKKLATLKASVARGDRPQQPGGDDKKKDAKDKAFQKKGKGRKARGERRGKKNRTPKSNASDSPPAHWFGKSRTAKRNISFSGTSTSTSEGSETLRGTAKSSGKKKKATQPVHF